MPDDLIPIARDHLASKLKEARQLSGLSTRAVVELIAARYKVSHTTLANFERGLGSPNVELLSTLATVYQRPLNWFLERGRVLSGVQYRNLSSKNKKIDLLRYEAESLRWLEAYIKIEAFLGRPLAADKPDLMTEVRRAPNGMVAAKIVRQGLEFRETEPISSVNDLLTKFGIRSIELETTLAVDGFAALFGDEPVVVLNPSLSFDRARMNAGHELGHVLFGDCQAGVQPSKAAEKRAFEFASHLLLPESKLLDAFAGQSMVRLVKYKEIYGISLAAMVMRASQAGLISEAQKKSLFIEFAKRGWRKSEPGQVRPDRASRFEDLVAEAVGSDRLSWKSAAALLGVREEELLHRRDIALGGVPQEDGFGPSPTIPIR